MGETTSVTDLELVGRECLCLQSRMTARAVTRKYNDVLAGHGLSITEFSLLVALSARPGLTATELADLLCFERTTLVRNLKGMAGKGLLVQKKELGPAVLSTVSELGERMLTSALPLWQLAQTEVKSKLTLHGPQEILDSVRELRDAALK